MLEIGECVWHLKPQSVGEEKLNSRWESGVVAGLKAPAGDLDVVTLRGVLKIRSCNRRPEEERWNQEEFGIIQGTPWEPIPGRKAIKVKFRFQEADTDKHSRSSPEEDMHQEGGCVGLQV